MLPFPFIFHFNAPQVLLVADDAFKASIRNPYGENIYACKDGVTPPMRKARQRHFKPAITLPDPHMREAVRDVMEILAGRWVSCGSGIRKSTRVDYQVLPCRGCCR
jgi:hypothetical protein